MASGYIIMLSQFRVQDKRSLLSGAINVIESKIALNFMLATWLEINNEITYIPAAGKIPIVNVYLNNNVSWSMFLESTTFKTSLTHRTIPTNLHFIIYSLYVSVLTI